MHLIVSRSLSNLSFASIFVNICFHCDCVNCWYLCCYFVFIVGCFSIHVIHTIRLFLTAEKSFGWVFSKTIQMKKRNEFSFCLTGNSWNTIVTTKHGMLPEKCTWPWNVGTHCNWYSKTKKLEHIVQCTEENNVGHWNNNKWSQHQCIKRL